MTAWVTLLAFPNEAWEVNDCPVHLFRTRPLDSKCGIAESDLLAWLLFAEDGLRCLGV